jgi:aspartate aminotransferase-like enzyme
MFAMDYQLDKMLAEGLDNRYSRHAECSQIVRDWAKKHFDIFTDERYLSNTLTVITNTRGISVADLNKELGRRGYQISNGYGSMKEKTFRIAHMAECTKADIEELLITIEDILGLK